MIRLENVLKMSSRRICETSWGRLEDVLMTSGKRLEDVLETFLQDILKTSWSRLEDVWTTRILVLSKTSWRRLKTSSEDIWLIRIYSPSSRRLEDVFWRRRRKSSSRGLQNVFIETIVCWGNKITFNRVISNISSMALIFSLLATFLQTSY